MPAHGSVGDDCSTSGTALSSYLYKYDANGNRAQQTEQRTSASTQALGAAEETQYAYDAQDRLAAVLYPAGRAVVYQFDAVGNRTGEREYTGVTARSVAGLSYAAPPVGTLAHDVVGAFNRADWLVSRTDGTDASKTFTFSYDLSGNVTVKKGTAVTRTFAWDARNTLTAVYDSGTEVGRYDYDQNLQRVKRKTASENVEYVLDDRFVLQETDGSTTGHPSRRRYHYGTEALAVTDGGTATQYITNDALGSLADLTTSGGTVGQARQYDAWGKSLAAPSP